MAGIDTRKDTPVAAAAVAAAVAAAAAAVAAAAAAVAAVAAVAATEAAAHEDPPPFAASPAWQLLVPGPSDVPLSWSLPLFSSPSSSSPEGP